MGLALPSSGLLSLWVGVGPSSSWVGVGPSSSWVGVGPSSSWVGVGLFFRGEGWPFLLGVGVGPSGRGWPGPRPKRGESQVQPRRGEWEGQGPSQNVRVAHLSVVNWALTIHRPPTAFPVTLVTGVLWVSTGTDPCGFPSRQDDGETKAPALHTLDDVLRFRGNEEYRAVLPHASSTCSCLRSGRS